MDNIQVLFVDDEESIQHLTKTYLEHKFDFSVDSASNGEEALERLEKKKYDAILSDYNMPVMDGIELLKRIRAKKSKIPFIIFTGRGREEVAMDALNCGADFYMQKGGDPSSMYDLLAHKIKKSVEFGRMEEERLQLLTDLKELINLAPHSAAIINSDMKIQYVNDNGKEVIKNCLNHYGDACGKTVHQILSREIADEFVDVMNTALIERRRLCFCRDIDGIKYDIQIAPHFKPSGDLRFYYCYGFIENQKVSQIS